jgi:Fe-S oxidoreductase
MCPSFQATRDEMHSTRGRANLLRAMISSSETGAVISEQDVFEALDLCLACKGCKAECPSSVDMAKLRYEFLHLYYHSHPRRVRDYLFGYIEQLACLGRPFAPVVNWLLDGRLVRRLAEVGLGIARERSLPRLSRQTLHQMLAARAWVSREADQPPDCLFLSDAFTNYFQPEAGFAAFNALRSSGFNSWLLPVLGAGRTLISKGFLPAARAHAARLVDAIRQVDPQGFLPVIAVEPSEIYTLNDEYPDLLPGDSYVAGLAQRVWTVEEWMIRQPNALAWVQSEGSRRGTKAPQEVILHPHCYQKAQQPRPDGLPSGGLAAKVLLETAGYSVRMVEAGCCGMAGAFGYEQEHYQLSLEVGEQGLLPALRKAISETNGDIIIAAAGVSCRAQIEDALRRPAFHPLAILAGKQ